MPQLLHRACSAASRAEALLARAAELERLLAACRRESERQSEALARLRGALAVTRTGSLESAASHARLAAVLDAAPRPARPRAASPLAVACVVTALFCSAPPRVEPATRQPVAPAPVFRPFPAPSAPTQAESEALRLVYGFRVPGKDRILLDVLERSETPGGPPPWKVEPVDGSVYAVTYTPADYEFEADIAAGTVKPSAETLARLD